MGCLDWLGLAWLLRSLLRLSRLDSRRCRFLSRSVLRGRGLLRRCLLLRRRRRDALLLGSFLSLGGLWYLRRLRGLWLLRLLVVLLLLS